MVARRRKLVTQCYKADRRFLPLGDAERVEDGAGAGGEGGRRLAAEKDIRAEGVAVLDPLNRTACAAEALDDRRPADRQVGRREVPRALRAVADLHPADPPRPLDD